jgi:hypothetical protein
LIQWSDNLANSTLYGCWIEVAFTGFFKTVTAIGVATE